MQSNACSVPVSYISVVQLQARAMHVARRGVFCGSQKHSEKIFKSEIC